MNFQKHWLFGPVGIKKNLKCWFLAFFIFLIRLGMVKNKVAIFLIFPAICHIFSIISLIFKLATAVDDNDIYTGHLILFVYPLWKISRSSTGVANPNFRVKVGKKQKKKWGKSQKMHFSTLFFNTVEPVLSRNSRKAKNLAAEGR